MPRMLLVLLQVPGPERIKFVDRPVEKIVEKPVERVVTRSECGCVPHQLSDIGGATNLGATTLYKPHACHAGCV